ncbi:MAG: sporulation protein YabP [Firmicutes bacterium]|nr:sporulation protein YabP [Bacillota bacterium]
MPEETAKQAHTITMQSRKKAALTGVTDVLSFDEECVVADTADGAIVLKGRELHISTLELEKGILILDGVFTSFCYEQSPAKTSVFARIFK